MSYIYRAIKKDRRWNPPKEEVLEFPTQAETITWLEKNGGGTFRNILHNVEFPVLAVEEGTE